MAAGARQVVASLWAADDRATARLMVRFHEERKAGADVHTALSRAQDHIRNNVEKGVRRWADPYYWAGWVVWGPGKE